MAERAEQTSNEGSGTGMANSSPPSTTSSSAAATDGEPRTITKADLIESVYEKVGFSKKDSSEVVERILETMKATLARGEKLKVSGFGKFEVRHKNTRRGRNPQTNMELQIPAHRVVAFKPSQVLKAAIAGEPLSGVSDDDLD